jgi:hypothetical protein
MATYKFLSESEYDETHKQYNLEVTATVSEDDVRVYEQQVIFKEATKDAQAQAYADELEAALIAQETQE